MREDFFFFCLLPRASMNKGTASSYRAERTRQVEGSPCRISRQGKRYLSYLLLLLPSQRTFQFYLSLLLDAAELVAPDRLARPRVQKLTKARRNALQFGSN